MRGYLRIWLLGFALLTPSLCFGEGPARSQDVAAHIAKLASSKFFERDHATRELLRIGQPAVEPLRSASRSTADMEVKVRAESIVSAIEARILNEALIRAPKIALKFDRAPLEVALGEVNKKTGLSLVLSPKSGKSPKEPVTLDTGEVPLWEAVEKFLAVAGLVEDASVEPANSDPRAPDLPRAPRPIPAPGLDQEQQAQDKNIRLIAGKNSEPVSNGTILRVKLLSKNSRRLNGSGEIDLTLDVTPAPSANCGGFIGVEVRRAIANLGLAMAQSYSGSGSADPNATNFWANGNVMMGGGGGMVVIRGGGRRGMAVQRVIINGGGLVETVQNVATPNQRHVSFKLTGNNLGANSLGELEGIITAKVLAPSRPLLTIEDIATVSTEEQFKADGMQIRVMQRQIGTNGILKVRLMLCVPVHDEGIMNGWQFGFNPVAVPAEGRIDQTQLAVVDHKGGAISGAQVRLVSQFFDGVTQNSEYMVATPFTGTVIAEDKIKLIVSGRKTVFAEVPFSLKNVPLP